MNSSQHFDLQKLGLQRPEKMHWFYEHTSQDPLQNCQSKSLKKILSKYQQILTDENLSIQTGSISKEEYLEWLPYYQARMEEQNYDLFANEEWYDKKVSEGFTVEKLFIYQNDDLIGTAILSSKDDLISFNFKASKRIGKFKSKSSIGSIIDFFFVKNALERNIPIISNGMARNASGVYNNVSYLEHKIRFGYTPKPSDEAPTSNQTPINNDGWVLFYGYKTNWETDGSLYLLKKAGTNPVDTTVIAAQTIPFVTIEY